jgi:hypothetical protein
MTATATLSNALVVGTGAHDLQASYGGDAGYSPSTSGTVSVVASQIATTLALGASSSSPSYGDQIVLTATLSPYGYKTVSTTGEVVTFYAGGVGLVLSETVQDFSVSFNGGMGTGTSLTAASGGTAIYRFTATPTGGNTFPAAVNFAVSGLPNGATACFLRRRLLLAVAQRR